MRWWRRLFRKSRGVCFARFHVAKDRADRVSLLQLHGDLGNLAFARRRHTHHGFVGFDLNNFLIVRNFITGLYLNIDNCGFGNRFAELRHDDWDLRHKFLFSKQRASFSRDLFCAGSMGRPKIWMIRDRRVFRVDALRRRVQQMKTFRRDARNYLGRHTAPWE